MISAFYWGTNYENILNFSYPLYDLLTDRVPRDGSDFVQGVSGLEDAWITGYDYTLEGEARYLQLGATSIFPAGPGGQGDPLGGALSLQGFLDWCRAKNTVRFVPDFLNAPGFFVDGCYLADPVKGGGGRGLTSRLDWTQKFKFRNPSVDFALALRGLMFEYAPGMDQTLSLPTFSRASIANYFSNQFASAQAAAGILRDRHYALGTLASRVGLVEASKINRCLQSQTLATSPWAQVGSATLTVTNAQPGAPDGSSTSCTSIPNAVSGTHGVGQAITITATEAVAASIFVKAGNYPAILFRFGDSGSTNGFHVTFDASTGLFGTVHAGFGTGVLTGFQAIPLANGWYRINIWGTVGGAITAGQVFCYVFDTIAHANAGSVFTGDGVSGLSLWGCQVERNGIPNGVFPNPAAAVPPTSYIATVAGTVTRSADSLQYGYPFPPQALWFYVKFIELGTLAQTGVLVGTGSGANAGLFWTTNASPLSYEFFHFRPGVPNVGSIFGSGPIPNVGDTVELLGFLNANGSVQGRMSINGAADVVGNLVTDSHQAFAAAWDSPILDFGATTGINGFQSVKVGPQGFLGSSPTTIAQARAA